LCKRAVIVVSYREPRVSADDIAGGTGGDEVRQSAVVIATAALLALSAWAWAAPSLVGPTGLIAVPTAEALGMAEWNLGATGVQVDDGDDATILYANVGLAAGLEAGVAREKVEGAEAETLVNAKLRLVGPLPGKVSVAAGMMDVTDQVDRSGYVVLSHTLGAGLVMRRGYVTSPQVHVGVGSGRLDGLFGGLSTTVSGRIGLMAEYDGENVNFGVRLPLAPKLEATAAALDGTEEVAVGLSFASPW
jgi:hypothetical protein